MPDHGYEHERTIMRGQHDPAHVLMPGVHRVASLLKRWLLGTHQGSVGLEHLDAYLNEFTFRFNRRGSRRRGLLFYRLLEQAILADPITYRSLIANPHRGRPRPTLPKRSPAITGRRATVAQPNLTSNRYPPDVKGAIYLSQVGRRGGQPTLGQGESSAGRRVARARGRDASPEADAYIAHVLRSA